MIRLFSKIKSFFCEEEPIRELSVGEKEIASFVRSILLYTMDDVITKPEAQGLRNRATNIINIYGSDKTPEIIDLLVLANRVSMVLYDNKVSTREIIILKKECADLLLKYNLS